MPRAQLCLGYVLVSVGVGVILGAPIQLGSDASVRFDMLDQLLRNHTLDHGRYSLCGPLVASPLWYLGEAIGKPVAVVFLFNRLLFLAGLAALWLVLHPTLPERERLNFTLLLLFGSMFPWHITSFFAEVFQVVFVGLGLGLIALRTGWRAWLGAILTVWGTVNVPASAVGLALAVLVLVWNRGQLRYCVLLIATAGLILTENWLRRGDWFDGGYAGEKGSATVLPYSGLSGFSYPLFFGLLALLFSFGKGLVFFTPGLFARYPEREKYAPADAEARLRLLYWLWMAVVVGLVLVYARWWAWYGGVVWGPRFLLFACLPASLVLARRLDRTETHSLGANLLLLLAVALSCWVGANGLVYREYDMGQFIANDYALEFLPWFVPECSVLWRPFVVHKPLDPHDVVRLIMFGCGFAYLSLPLARTLARQLQGRLIVWWQNARSTRWRF